MNAVSLYILDAEFDGIEMKSQVVFNKRQVKTAGLSSEDFSGPVVSAAELRLSWHFEPNYCVVFS